MASDVSTEAVERTAAATYARRELGELDSRLMRYLEPVEGGWRVARALRDHVTVVHHNLAAGEPPREARGAVAVFCRNVLIYLGADAQRAFLDGLASRLHSLEVLFLGATESLWGVTERFVPVGLDNAYAYRPAGRPGGGTAPPSRPPAPRAARPVAAPARAQQPPPRPPAPAEPGAAVHIAEGEAALAAGDAGAAVAAFRKACYLDAEDRTEDRTNHDSAAEERHRLAVLFTGVDIEKCCLGERYDEGSADALEGAEDYHLAQ